MLSFSSDFLWVKSYTTQLHNWTCCITFNPEKIREKTVIITLCNLGKNGVKSVYKKAFLFKKSMFYGYGKFYCNL